MWPKDRWMFGFGMYGLLMGILSLGQFHSPYQTTLGRCLGLAWFLYAAVFVYRAYRPKPPS
jgi:hypothetical protein